jgi:hypothetical protein
MIHCPSRSLSVVPPPRRSPTDAPGTSVREHFHRIEQLRLNTVLAAVAQFDPIELLPSLRVKLAEKFARLRLPRRRLWCAVQQSASVFRIVAHRSFSKLTVAPHKLQRHSRGPLGDPLEPVSKMPNQVCNS